MTKIKNIALGWLSFLAVGCSSDLPTVDFYVGTYADSTHASGIFEVKSTPKGVESQLIGKGNFRPSYLHYDHATQAIYGVGENGLQSKVYRWSNGFEGLKQSPEGFAITSVDPCHIQVLNGTSVVANYSSGSTLIGAETAAPQYVQHHGSSVNAERQTQSHVHMTLASKDGTVIFATDLGADKIYTYDWDSKTKRIQGVRKSTPAPAGSGPRFMAWHPKLDQLYVLTEMDATVLRFDFENGNLNWVDTTALMPSDWEGEHGGSHLAFSKDGQFLYAANRGTANAILVFRVAADGSLTKMQQFDLEGKGPRHFAFSLNEDVLLVANQFSDEIEFVERNSSNGKLTKTVHKEKVPQPSCILVKAL